MTDQKSDAGADAGDTKSITVGEKTYSAEQVTEMISGQAAATKIMQKFAPIQQLAEKYNMSVEDLPGQFEGSAGAISRLIDEGLLDDHGQIVKQDKTGGSDDGDLFAKLLKDTGGGQSDLPDKGPGKAVLDALSSITSQTEAGNKRMQGMEDTIAGLTRHLLAMQRQMVRKLCSIMQELLHKL